jgi:hypothetical protein
MEARDVGSVPLSEHSRVLIALHRAMRADSQRLIRSVPALPDGGTQEATALGRAFGLMVTLIHDHHWTEDDIMYPFLLARVSTFEHDALQLEDDHVQLDAAMSRINARFRLLGHPLSPRLWQDTQARLVADVAEFEGVLTGHLDREEAVIVPAVDSLMSAAEQHTLHKEESKRATYRHMRMAVPWVLANASPEEARELRGSAPRLLSVVNDHVWEREFRRDMSPLYGP